MRKLDGKIKIVAPVTASLKGKNLKDFIKDQESFLD